MDFDIEIGNFLAMLFACAVVIGVVLYGAVRCFFITEVTDGLKILLVLPAWFVANFLLGRLYSFFVGPNYAGTHPFEYIVWPVYLIGAGLVCYFVIRHIRWLTVPPPGTPKEFSSWSWLTEQNPGDARRRIAGAAFTIVGAVALATTFLIPGVLLIIVGVSLLMNVRIWRS